jgi:hypothetical protein
MWVTNDPSEQGFASYALRAAGAEPSDGGRELHGWRMFTCRTWLIFLAQGGLSARCCPSPACGAPRISASDSVCRLTAAAVCSVMIVCWATPADLGYLSDRIGGGASGMTVAGAIGAAIGWTTMFYAPLPLAAFRVVAALTNVACAPSSWASRTKVDAGSVSGHDPARSTSAT